MFEKLSEKSNINVKKGLALAGIGAAALGLAGCGGDSELVTKVSCEQPEATPQVNKIQKKSFRSIFEIGVVCRNPDGSISPVADVQIVPDDTKDQKGILAIKGVDDGSFDTVELQSSTIENGQATLMIVGPDKIVQAQVIDQPASSK